MSEPREPKSAVISISDRARTGESARMLASRSSRKRFQPRLPSSTFQATFCGVCPAMQNPVLRTISQFLCDSPRSWWHFFLLRLFMHSGTMSPRDMIHRTHVDICPFVLFIYHPGRVTWTWTQIVTNGNPLVNIRSWNLFLYLVNYASVSNLLTDIKEKCICIRAAPPCG